MHRPQLILASGSPRRRELLAAAGYEFEVIAPDESVECGVCSQNGPAGLVADLAFRKASAVREVIRQGDKEKGRQGAEDGRVLIAADTVAELDGFVLGKPRDEDHARGMLRQLRGRAHRVLTGVCVWPLPHPGPLPEGEGESLPRIEVAVTKLVMNPLSDEAIEDYLATGEWRGKAGSFGYQDRLGWVHIEEGSESNVVGLPMELLAEMLAGVKLKGA
jgi:septum formation protein